MSVQKKPLETYVSWMQYLLNYLTILVQIYYYRYFLIKISGSSNVFFYFLMSCYSVFYQWIKLACWAKYMTVNYAYHTPFYTASLFILEYIDVRIRYTKKICVHVYSIPFSWQEKYVYWIYVRFVFSWLIARDCIWI